MRKYDSCQSLYRSANPASRVRTPASAASRRGPGPVRAGDRCRDATRTHPSCGSSETSPCSRSGGEIRRLSRTLFARGPCSDRAVERRPPGSAHSEGNGAPALRPPRGSVRPCRPRVSTTPGTSRCIFDQVRAGAALAAGRAGGHRSGHRSTTGDFIRMGMASARCRPLGSSSCVRCSSRSGSPGPPSPPDIARLRCPSAARVALGSRTGTSWPS